MIRGFLLQRPEIYNGENLATGGLFRRYRLSYGWPISDFHVSAHLLR